VSATEEVRLRPWPKGVRRSSAFRHFVSALRAAFDSDPEARYCAAELEGVTVVVAVGRDAEKLQAFVRDSLYGVIELSLLRDSDA
jgi:hypothetical protein